MPLIGRLFAFLLFNFELYKAFVLKIPVFCPQAKENKGNDVKIFELSSSRRIRF